MRGLHYQLPEGAGEARPQRQDTGRRRGREEGSPTFGQYVSAELGEENGDIPWIPRGSRTGSRRWRIHDEHAPERERRVSYRHVKWPLEVAAVSDEDGRCPEWPAPRDPAILAGRMVGAARNLGK